MRLSRVHIEKQLHVFEDIAVPILSKLGAGDLGITNEQRGEFAGFMALSMCRTPVFMQTIDRVAISHQMASLQYWHDHPDLLARCSSAPSARHLEINFKISKSALAL